MFGVYMNNERDLEEECGLIRKNRKALRGGNFRTAGRGALTSHMRASYLISPDSVPSAEAPQPAQV